MSLTRNKSIILVAVFLLLTSLACTSLDGLLPDIGGDDTSEALKLSDDFSQEGSGWEVGSFEGGDIGYFDGKYRVTSNGDGSTMWGAAGRSFEDVIIEVDAKQISAPANNNNDYGVICRLQRDGAGYYGLVSGDGFFTILRENGENGFDVLVDWVESGLIKQGNAQNRIGLSCLGSKISLYVNGELLAETSDSMFSSGDIGFTVTSYELESTEVHFDNLTVK